MCQWVLKANGQVVHCRTVRPLKEEEKHSPVEIKKREAYDVLIDRRWRKPMATTGNNQ